MNRRTVGVEEELLLVDTARNEPAPQAMPMVAEAERLARDESAGGSERDAVEPSIEHEFKQEQVEIGSSPQSSLAELRADLVALRAEAALSASRHGVRIAALATSPWKLRPRATPDERYQRMNAEFGLLSREQLTCGQHVHVGIGSRHEGVAILDRIRGWLPVLLAISANSPFWQGQDTGYASFRSVLWGRWPTAGPTEMFGDEDGYQRALDEALGTGAALDDGMIYFDARLSARYPTLEIRVADVCTDVDDAVLIAALARALADTAFAGVVLGEPAPRLSAGLLRAATWRAARWGLSGELVDPRSGHRVPAHQLLAELLTELAPALRRSGDHELVAAGFARLASAGTGAQRQRAAYAGRQDLHDVVSDAADRTLAG